MKQPLEFLLARTFIPSFVLTGWLVLALAPSNLAAQENGKEADSVYVEDYQAYIAGSSEATVWLGERVAVVLDGEQPADRDAVVMGRICQAFDAIFDAYDEVTQRQPELNAPFQDRIRIEVSSAVGGGLAHHGRLGVGIGDGFFHKLYERVQKGENTYDQVFFYEIARNYWMSDMNPTIDYHTSKGPDDWGWWTVGFNNAMSIVMPDQIEEIDDMYYFGSNGQTFSDGMESNLNTYLQHPDQYNWENSWCVPLVPWKERTSVNDLMTGLLIRLQRDHGGIEFMKGLYREIPRQRPFPKDRADYQAARDNFYAAASLAAKKDLYKFFSEDLRWTISASAHERVIAELRN